MWERVSCFIVMALVSSVLLSGCSQSDDKSATSDWKPSQEVIVINGHTLPPEPNPAINNSTLLGVDSNDNEVRDDVEIWIYKKYKDKHPIHIDIAMQAGRAYKLVLEHPEKAKAIRQKVNAPYFCASYYKDYVKFFNEPVLVHDRIDSSVNSNYFNTKKRSNIYWEYDTLLSGGSYPLPKIREMKSMCDFNTSKYEGKND